MSLAGAVPRGLNTGDRSIRLLTTGGTISSVYDPALGRTRPALTGSDLLGALGEIPGIRDVEVEEVFRLPSWALRPTEMFQLAQAVRRAASDPRCGGVVVTHGTTTLEYSAFLADLFLDTETAVVFTGAMREADVPDTDGPRNLRDALRVAASPDARGKGVLLCLNGTILAARDAVKQHRTAVQAFEGLDGPLGYVDGEMVAFYRQPLRRRVFTDGIEPRVGLVKAYPGAGREAVDALVAAGIRGLVVEGLPGAGGVPPAMQAGLRDAAARGVVLVLASRAQRGRIPARAAGGTGAPLRDLQPVYAGTLTAEKAWVLLLAALGESADREEVRQAFAAVAP